MNPPLGPEGETPRELFADKPRTPNPRELYDLLQHAKQRATNELIRKNRRVGADDGSV
jgi:hypothetical protein